MCRPRISRLLQQWPCGAEELRVARLRAAEPGRAFAGGLSVAAFSRRARAYACISARAAEIAAADLP
jgi:hypothetical protein